MQKIGFCDKYSLTQAVLNGKKTMTRRLEKGLQRSIAEYEKMYHETFNFNTEYQSWGSTINKLVVGTPHATIYVPTRYKLGEVVAVAQSYEAIRNERYKDYCNDIYNPFGAKEPDLESEPGWTNKLFVKPDLMPHQIKITGVRIERLQAISYEDCLKEGVICETFDDGTPLCYKVLGIYDKPKSLLLKEFTTPREAFAALINRPGVGRKGLWESNPFVVVYEFKLVK